MADEYISYFIGGPLDLSKRTSLGARPERRYSVATFERIGEATIENNVNLRCVYHWYRLAHRVQNTDGICRPTYVYEYDGEEEA